MRKKRTLIITAILVVALGLLTVSLALAGQGTSDSLASVSGGSSNPSGTPLAGPDLGSTLLIDQQPNQSNGFFSDANCGNCGSGQQSIADDFVLADTYNINNIVLWGGFFPSNTSSPDDFRVRFLDNSGGNLPNTASVLYDESNVPANTTQTGVVLFGVNEVVTVLTLTNPLELTPGTYWVEVFHNTVGNPDSYFWEVGNLDAANGRFNNSFAFQTPGVTWNPGNPQADSAYQLWGSLPGQPGIALSKTPASQTVTSGGNATFSITVTNTGTVDLDNVNVSDALVPACDNAIGMLAVSQTVSYGCQDIGVTASYTNVATVSSQLVTGAPGPTATASAEVIVVAPTGVSLTGFGEDAATFSPILLVAILALVVGVGFAIRRKVTA